MCVLSGDNQLWPLLQMTFYLDGTGFLPLGVGLKGEGELMSTPRSLPFWPLPAKEEDWVWVAESPEWGGKGCVNGASPSIHCMSPLHLVLTYTTPPLNTQPNFLKWKSALSAKPSFFWMLLFPVIILGREAHFRCTQCSTKADKLREEELVLELDGASAFYRWENFCTILLDPKKW